MLKKTVLLLIVLLVLTGCASSSSIVVDATAADWIWGVEELESGAVRVWMRYDDIAGYCAVDEDLARTAVEHVGDYVLFKFKSVRWGDEENSAYRGCARLDTGVDTSTPIFKLTDIQILEE